MCIYLVLVVPRCCKNVWLPLTRQRSCLLALDDLRAGDATWNERRAPCGPDPISLLIGISRERTRSLKLRIVLECPALYLKLPMVPQIHP